MDEIIYVDQLPEIKEALKTQHMLVLLNQQNLDLRVKNGMTLDPEACKEQAEWSINQKRFSARLLPYLTTIPQYKEWDEQTLILRQNFTRQDKQLIGLIELLVGSCQLSEKLGHWALLHIVEPETYCHPAVVAHLMSVITAIMKDFKVGQYGGQATKKP